jgi:short-subunit dehydrogenase
MDKRETFDSLQKLKNILAALQQQQQHVSLLLDNVGLSRMEGIITSMDERTDMITVNGTDTVLVNHIVAVNGRFRSDYSEC